MHIYAKINDILVTANKFGQIPFQEIAGNQDSRYE